MKTFGRAGIFAVLSMTLLFSACTGEDNAGEESAQTTYTAAQIAEHDAAGDCWMAIDGKVYDVTEFIGRHPGGNEILQGCGTDATAIFHARPGSGTDHSSMADAQLTQYQIGVLSEE
jgi:cytochrome b involved in lipid metabolism